MLNIIVSNSRFWKLPGTRDMIIFGFHVGPHIPDIGDFEVYEVYEGYMMAYEGI